MSMDSFSAFIFAVLVYIYFCRHSYLQELKAHAQGTVNKQTTILCVGCVGRSLLNGRPSPCLRNTGTKLAFKIRFP